MHGSRKTHPSTGTSAIELCRTFRNLLGRFTTAFPAVRAVVLQDPAATGRGTAGDDRRVFFPSTLHGHWQRSLCWWQCGVETACEHESISRTSPNAALYEPASLLSGRHGRRCTPSTMTVRDFYRSLAKLGGFPGRKRDGEPGWITIWRGFEKLQLIIQGVEFARTG